MPRLIIREPESLTLEIGKHHRIRERRTVGLRGVEDTNRTWFSDIIEVGLTETDVAVMEPEWVCTSTSANT